MDLYRIVTESGVDVNTHYLKRYLKFVSSFKEENRIKFKTELHHILPESMFGDYSDLRKNRQNGAHLRNRAHCVAHILLTKVFPRSGEMQFALYAMSNQKNEQQEDRRVNSRFYAKAREESARYISSLRRGKNASQETKNKLKEVHSSPESRLNNTFRQMRLNPFFEPKELESAVLAYYDIFGSNVTKISESLGIGKGHVLCVLKIHNIEDKEKADQSKTKFERKYPKFSSYKDFLNQVSDLHLEGLSVFRIPEILEVHQSCVETALKRLKLAPNKTKRISGPKTSEGKSRLGMKKGSHIWITNGLEALRLPKDSKIPDGFTKGRRINR